MSLSRAFITRFLAGVCVCATASMAQGGAVNSCDLNADGLVDGADVNVAVQMLLGNMPCRANIAGPGVCDAVVIQRIVVAALGGECRLSNGSHSVQLTWAPSNSPNVAGYNVFRASSTGGPYTQMTSTVVPATGYLDTAVEAGKTYYYVVTAVDTANVSSLYSNEAAGVVPSP